jgi:4-amino-4-deoxy-L-arabinose transferase-like glycosyltransferase
MLQNNDKYKIIGALAIIVFITIFFGTYASSGDITATPKFWRDEAIPFELARTYYELGKMDVVVAPGEVDGRPYLTHATGYPLLIPMAGVFSVFGVGVLQARIFMIFWIVATVIALFFILKIFLGLEGAVCGVLLVASFAPFYANGRTFTGEIPGFLFLILALYFLINKNNYISSGFFLGLAAVTKPSVYLLIIPTTFLYLLFVGREKFYRKAVRLILGALPCFIVWIYIIVPHPLNFSDWAGMIDLYRHPFNTPSILADFGTGVKQIITHSTIIYFTLITILMLLALRNGGYNEKSKKLVMFSFIYGVFGFIYFLRSPGWFRYLLVYQLLALATIFPAIDFLGRKIKIHPAVFVLALFIIHSTQYLLFSNIQSGTKSIETAQFINRELLEGNSSTIGFIYMPTVAPLIAPDRKYQIATIGGKEVYGKNPLSLPPDKLPTFVVSYNNEYGEYGTILEGYYKSQPRAEVRGLKIYEKK